MSIALTDAGGLSAGEPYFTYSGSGRSNLQKRAIRAVEVLFGARRIEHLYRQWRAAGSQFEGSIFGEALRVLSLTTDLDAGAADLIPRTGGLLVVANHPFGVADGLAIGDVVSRVRPDVKLMVHSELCRPPEVQHALLPVDFGHGAESRRVSATTRKLAVEWLDQGHVLVVFPAGGIATAPRPFSRSVADFAWHPFVARLATRAGVQVLPIFVHGQNSRLFQVVSHYSYSLRVALVFRETLRLQGRPVRLDIGTPFSVTPGQNGELAARLRQATFLLGGVSQQIAQREFAFPKRIRF